MIGMKPSAAMILNPELHSFIEISGGDPSKISNRSGRRFARFDLKEVVIETFLLQ
jgi:hypothetical protein